MYQAMNELIQAPNGTEKVMVFGCFATLWLIIVLIVWVLKKAFGG